MADRPPHLKPFLKWAGGKRQLLVDIRALLHERAQSTEHRAQSTEHRAQSTEHRAQSTEHRAQIRESGGERTYFEPFVGGGAVFFDLMPERAVINDINVDLITCYRVIQSAVDELIERLHAHAAAHSKTHYYAVRARDRDSDYAHAPDTEKAARLIYLNRTCFNGLYRVNQRGHNNVPMGRYANPVICDVPVLRAVHAFLRNNDITILQGSYAAATGTARAGDLVYFDPPYHSPAKRNFTAYDADGFDESAQIALAAHFRALAARGVDCVLSNADTPFIRQVFAGYAIRTVQATRAINAIASGRAKISEVLIPSWGDA